MPVVRLTDITVRALKPAAERTTYWDETLPAFGVRVGRRVKVFIVMHGKARKRIVLGRYPPMKLQTARKQAQAIIYGPDPQDEQDAIPAAEAVAQFIDTHHTQSRERTRKEQERLLTKHFLSKHRTTPLNRITRQQLLEITDGLKGAPSEQLHVHRAFKTFFKWASQRQIIAASPVADLPPPSKQQDRDRLLTDDEIKRIYKAANDLGYPFGYIVLIAIHTGLRRSEVGSLKWSYITPDYITIPKELTKNGREHVLPNLINDNLALIPKTEIDGRVSEYLFPSGTGRPFGDWFKSKAKLDKLCQVNDFVLHDFRRYLSSTMRKLQVPIDVTEAILNHVSGSRSKVQRIYDRHDRLPEMREALQLYEKHLASLISPR